jgi:hypothetical protein
MQYSYSYLHSVYSFEILRKKKRGHGLQIDLPKASEEDNMGVEDKTSQVYHHFLNITTNDY